MKITLLIIFETLPGKSAQMEQALEALAIEARREAGCELFVTHRVSDAPGIYVLYEQWRDSETLDAHNAGPSVLRMSALLPELVKDKPKVSKLESLA